jgi:hypothetical protein
LPENTNEAEQKWRPTMKRRKRIPECKILIDKNERGDGEDMFVVFDGIKIATRGDPESPQARTWVIIEPGCEIIDDEARGTISVLRHHNVPVN